MYEKSGMHAFKYLYEHMHSKSRFIVVKYLKLKISFLFI